VQEFAAFPALPFVATRKNAPRETMSLERPLILLDPHPRRSAEFLDAPTLARLNALGEVVAHDGGPMPAARVDELLPRVKPICLPHGSRAP
jgi:hypothetical protein